MQQSDAFRFELIGKLIKSSDIAGGTIETCNQASFYGIAAPSENDGNRFAYRLCRQGDRLATGRHNYRHMSANQFGHQCGQPIIMPSAQRYSIAIF